MKNIILPKELLNLPQPWAMTHSQLRSEALGSLSYEFNSIKTALNVLERCLHTLSELTFGSSDYIPEELYELWTFSAEWLAETIPTFDEFDLIKVEQFLITEEGFDSPSPELIRDVGDYWLWWITWDIERAALRWVEDALITTREPILISRYLHITSRYWQKIEPRFAQSLLSSSAIIGWQKALPLFLSVEQSLAASEEVKETARDYRKYVLLYPHRWLPEPEPEKSPAKESQRRQRLTQSMSRRRKERMQPALGPLTYLSQ